MKRFIVNPHPLVVAAIALASIAALAWHISHRSAQNIADEFIYSAVVKSVVSTNQKPHPVRGTITEQSLVVDINFGDKRETQTIVNDFVPVEEGDGILIQAPLYKKGDSTAQFLDVQRNQGLIKLVIAFVGVVAIVGGVTGLYAVVGLIFSFAVIFLYTIPQILNGADPILTGLVGALAILTVTLYCSHGFNRKSFAALVGIFAALLLVGFLANFVVSDLRFSGQSSEESVYLQSAASKTLDIVGILIAGIIIAVIGVLDDVAITQASTVESLSSLDPGLRGRRLFKKAMEVGKDHISAVINTLILAYTGAALPLILLLAANDFPISFTLNGEIVAEEIVRTMVSSIGLVLAVPVTTLVAVLLVSRSEKAGS